MANNHHFKPGLGDLSPMPDWLKQHLLAERKTIKQGELGLRRSKEHWDGLAIEPVVEGGRNHAVASLTGKLLRCVEPRLAHTLIHSFNQTNCKPPLPPAEVERTFISIGEAERARRKGLHFNA